MKAFSIPNLSSILGVNSSSARARLTLDAHEAAFISSIGALRLRLLAAVLLVFCLSFGTAASAQSGLWTWEGGSSTVPGSNEGQPGVYGTLGTPAPANIPGGRGASATWTDHSGNTWLFGGYGFDQGGNVSYLNDLWKLNPSTNEWTWMSGSSTIGTSGGQPGVYGVLGIAAAGNVPGGRADPSSWTDSSGNLWLFGGYGYDMSGQLSTLNDVWEFNPTSSQWTWMGGSNTVGPNFGWSGVYGILGTPAPGNLPGSRYFSTAWTDSSGNFWLFGGYGFSGNGNFGYLNDLWEFNPTSNEWAWMGGGNSVAIENGGASGVYGKFRTPAASNMPGGHAYSTSWVDIHGNVWLFGGGGFDANGNFGYLNDLWELNSATSVWAWMGGSSTVINNGGDAGVYGTLGIPAGGNSPGGRETAIGWLGSGDTLWLFGGVGYDANDTFGSLGDLWTFSPSKNQWTWVGGSSTPGAVGQAGVYGTLGTPAATNFPGSRYYVANWIDSSGVFWIFGGLGEDSGNIGGDLNDLWKFQSAAALTSPAPGKIVAGPNATFIWTPAVGATNYELLLGSTGVGSSNIYDSGSQTVTTLPVTVLPTGGGPIYARLITNFSGIPVFTDYTYTDASPPPTLSATSLSFVNENLGTSSASQSVTLTNKGAGSLSITSIKVTGANASSFVFANTCGTILAGGANCSIHGHFNPVLAGALTATVTITDSATNTPQSIALSGTGQGPGVSLSATSLAFGSQNLGTSSTSQMVTLTNPGNAALTITSIVVTGANASSFVFGNTCGTTLGAGANCTIHGHFAPAKSGALTASITIVDNAGNSPQTIALSGTGQGAVVSLSPTSLSYGSVTVGTASASQVVTLTNTGNEDLSITSINVTGAGASSFVFANNCGPSLAAGANCTIHGHFAPVQGGATTAAVTITDSASNSPQSIALSGTGLGPTVSLSATSLSFGSVAVGRASASKTVTMTNTGNATLTITSITLTGANASSFVFANNCGSSLSVGANCTIHGHFAPTATGSLTAAVTITDNTGNSPQNIALSGTGQ